MSKLVTLRDTTTLNEVLHPETEAGAVLLNDGTNLSAKLNSIDSAINDKLDAPAQPSMSAVVYIDSRGSVWTRPMVVGTLPNSVAVRSATGTLKGTQPTEDNDLTTKVYVDELVDTKLNNIDVATNADIDNLPLFN